MSRKSRAAWAVVGAAVLMAAAFTAGTTSAAPTGAAEGWDDCARGHVCLWDKPGFGGEKILDWKPRHRYGERYNFPDSASNRANSIRNNSNFHVRLHNLRNAMGLGHPCFPAETGHGELHLLGFGNSARSATTEAQC